MRVLKSPKKEKAQTLNSSFMVIKSIYIMVADSSKNPLLGVKANGINACNPLAIIKPPVSKICLLKVEEDKTISLKCPLTLMFMKSCNDDCDKKPIQ